MSASNQQAAQEDEKKRTEVPFTPNPNYLDGVPDLSRLPYLEMRNVLNHCHYRYCKMPHKHCYTSLSTILLAINPYERLPIYGQDIINEFHDAQKKGKLPRGTPHPYGVSAQAYMRMVAHKRNQSIILCGQSGSGKTETSKLLLRYLATTAPSTSAETSIVKQQIIAASPILEAFGNAKTVYNDNASRFAKFTKILYADNGVNAAREACMVGGYLETHLLEKSRVVFQANDERNFHIPYFLYQGLPQEKHADFGIVHPAEWHYTNQGGCVEVPGINDVERYNELCVK